MIPEIINAGDSVSWKTAPSSDKIGNEISSTEGWELKHYLKLTGGVTAIEVTATDDPDSEGWISEMTAEATGELEAGEYSWTARATKDSQVITIYSGKLTVRPNIEAEVAYDGRSQAEKDLAAVQAAMRSMISGGGVQEYTIGGRSIKKMTIEDLIKLESKLKAEVVREKKADRIKNGLGNPNNMFVRFR